MAKRTIIERKAKKENIKGKLYDIIGTTLAQELDFDVLQLKDKGIPECILVTDNDTDYTIVVTQKKNCIEYTEESIVKNFCELPTVEETTEEAAEETAEEETEEETGDQPF